ncbi:MAG TPA: hypothetical protein VM580_06460 [Labilithrix sp.]|nr:hypothetical protein [Labilithrix sp.]
MLALVRLPLARITRTPRGWLPIVTWSAVALLAALLMRKTGQSSGADHVLRGIFGVVVLPLLTYGVVSATLGAGNVWSAIRSLVALGAKPGRAVLASVVVAMVAAAVVCGIVAAAVCVLAHGEADPPLAWDVPASFGVAFMGGAAYAAYFCAGSAIGRGAMRGGFLAIDYIVGASSGFGALFTPRGHVMSLLGGPACFELSPRTSSMIIVLVSVAYISLAIRLGGRAR